MKLTFLGTGTSQGVPLLLSDNKGLDLTNPKNWRTRSCVHLEIASKHVQVDAGPEFRLQCQHNNIEKIDCFILTHGHADHIVGMDDLRRFCDLKESKDIDVYGEDFGLRRVQAIFPYAINAQKNRGYPCFNLFEMPESLDLGDGAKIESCLLPHGNVNTLGLVFSHNDKRLAYFCDCKMLTERAMQLAKDIDVLIIDGLRPQKHPSHLSIYEAVEYAQQLGAKKTYITHTTHLIDYDTWQAQLPENVYLAYDNLQISL
ncbi:MAG: MBL fold metallo-hydrolase [Opitutales bacterium]